HTHFAGNVFVVVHANHDTLGVDVVNHAATAGLHSSAGVNRHRTFDARTDQRLLGTQAGNSLTLHVGAHQCPVGVVVLQERNQRGSYRYDLRRGNVHVVDVFRRSHQRFTSLAAGNEVVDEAAFLIQLRVRLSDDVVAFLDSREIVDLVADFAVNDHVVRRFQETVLVQTSVQRHGVDQTDVRAFRRFDRTYTTVVRGMHVTNFKASAFTRQTARAECGDTTLVRDLRQRVGLIHELRELARTEELLDGRRNGLGVDQVVRHQVFGFGLAEAFLNCTLDTHQTCAELVLGQFANTTYATVAQMVDVIDLTTAVTQLNQHLDGFKDIFVGERQRAAVVFAVTQTAVDLHPANARKVVRFFAVEETVEQGLDGILGGRLTRAHHAIDGHTGGVLVGRFVRAQSGGNVATAVQIIDEEGLDLTDVGRADVSQDGLGDFVVRVGDDFTGFRVNNVGRQYAPDEEVLGYRDAFDTGVGQVTDMFGRNPLVLLDDDIAIAPGDVETGNFALPAFRNELQ